MDGGKVCQLGLENASPQRTLRVTEEIRGRDPSTSRDTSLRSASCCAQEDRVYGFHIMSLYDIITVYYRGTIQSAA